MKKTTETYDAYINSDAWSAKRSQYLNSGRPTACVVCGSKEIHLHHRTYARFGHEDLDDLVPLCQEHHSLLHQYQRDEGLTVEVATKRYLDLPDARRRRERYGSVKGPLPKSKALRRVESRKAKEKAIHARLGLGLDRPTFHQEPERTETGAIRSSGNRKVKNRTPKPRSATKKTQPYPF